jgi:hypothetical protein
VQLGDTEEKYRFDVPALTFKEVERSLAKTGWLADRLVLG